MLDALRAVGGRSRRRLSRLSTVQLVDGFLLSRRASGRAGGTLDWYGKKLGRLIADLGVRPADAITADDLRRWLVTLKEGRQRPTSDVYVEGHRKAAAAMFTWAVRERHLRRSPMEQVERFRVTRGAIRTISRDEMQMLLAQQPETHEGIRNRAILATMYDTGIRVGELVRLKLEDVDLEQGEARITGKNRSVESVPLSPALRAVLWSYITKARPRELFAGTGYLFVSRDGGALTTNAVRQWLRRAKMRAGLAGKRVSPHVIRASFATEYARNGGDAFTLQKILRHRSRDMADRYVAVAKADVVRQHAISSPLQRMVRGA